MGSLIMAIEPLTTTIILLVIFLLLCIALILLIRKNALKRRQEKFMLISDLTTINKLLRLIDYRIKSKKTDIYFTLLMVSIDDFDRIVQLITPAGAELYLSKLQDLLRRNLPVGAKMAQTTEQEAFIIYLPKLYDNNDLENVATTFKNIAEQKLVINGCVPVEKAASVSVTAYPAHGDNVVKLVNNLLSCMYSIKRSGGNSISIYNPEMDNDIQNTDRYKAIKQDIDVGNMKIRFNPLMNLKTNEIGGLECIINRINDNGTSTEYGRLLSYLEETNDDFWFTIWGVERALLSNLDIIRSGDYNDFIVTLKAGYKFMVNDDSAFKLQTSLERYRINPSNVVLELDNILDNESGSRYVKNLLQMQGVGIKIIANIKNTDRDLNRLIEVYDVDMLKMDAKALIRPNEYVKSILKESYNYRKKIIVTNVETKEELDKLTDKSIAYIEGSYYGMSLTKEQINNKVYTKEI